MATSSKEKAAEAVYLALVTPHFHGIMIGTLLSGVVMYQLVEFFTTWEKASKRRTFDISLVSVIAVAGGALLALDWLVAYNTFIANRSDVMYPYIWRTPDYLQPPVIALASAASQLWFIERAWRLTGSKILFGIFAILIIALEIGAAFALLPIGVLYGRDPAYFCTLGTLLVVQNWASAAVDLIATTTLLVKVRELVDAPLSRKSPVTTLLRLTFTTGAICAIVAIAAGTLYEITWRYANYWIPFVLILPRLSSISCLVTINHRNRWRADISGLQKHPDAVNSAFSFSSPRERDLKAVETMVLGMPLLGKTDSHLQLDSFHPPPHISEIGSVGDLERALMEFGGRAGPTGLDPEVETVVGSVEVLRKNERPFGHKRVSSGATVGSGITVATVFVVEVEHRRSSSFSSV